jgi:plasmid maintenance system antidote protein VapI
MSKLIAKLDKIGSQKSSDWIEKAEWEISNEGWLDKSAKIALKILRTIRKKNITQIKLAELLNVSPQHISKIVQGKENLTLETISKIEKVLNITLINIPGYQQLGYLSASTNKHSNVAEFKTKYQK